MPLFPFVWQYSNQPIEQLAADVAEIVINDANFIPISSGTTFENSPIFSNGSVMRSLFGGTLEGFVIDAFNNNYKFGAIDGGTSFTNLEIADNIGDIKMTAVYNLQETTWGVQGNIRTLYANGVAANIGAGVISTNCLKVKVDGVNYRVPLYTVV